MISSPEPRIAFVLTYYGKWPWYWRLWAQSVAANPAFEFIVLTDLPEPEYVPANIRIIPMPYPEVLRRISAAIDVPLRPATYHKLCDFKLFHGLAFADLLGPYAYWGYCDVDLFFGDLNPLFEMAKTERFDFLSPWECTIGHCTLVRNTARVNSIGLSIPNMRSRSLLPETTFMDEGALSETASRAGGFTFGVAADLSAEWRKSRCFLGASARHDGTIAALPGTFLVHYSDDRVFIYDSGGQRHEVLYFHFMGMKADRYWRDFKNCDPKAFSFTPYGLVPGLLDPAALQSLEYRWRSAYSQLPGFLYRCVRDLVPENTIGMLKGARVRLNKLVRG